MVEWKCATGHTWLAKVQDRVHGMKCSYCFGTKVLAGFNDLTATHSELVKQWDATKNDRVPSEFKSTSNFLAHWKDEEGHEWAAKIQARIRPDGTPRPCAFCSNQKVLPGFNDLETTNPVLASEWDIKKNRTTAQAHTRGSTRSVWWICEKDHSWKAPIKRRSAGHGCPHCTYKISKPERLIRKLLAELGYEVVGNTRTVIPPKEIDIWIPSLQLGIEFNGIYWHDKAKWLADLENRTSFSPEAQKTLMAKNQGLTLVHIWEDDWTKVREKSRFLQDLIIETTVL